METATPITDRKNELLELLKCLDSIKNHADRISEILEEVAEYTTEEWNTEIRNAIRARVQYEAETSHLKNSPTHRSMINMATGSGKSKVAIDLTSYYNTHSITSTPRFLIVVPTEKLRDENWKEEYLKWNKAHLWENCIERACYASLHKYENEVFDLVILDEGHNITPNNAVFFEKNIAKACLLMTATEPRDPIKREILKKLAFVKTYTLTLDDAVKLGIVAPYEVTVVTTYLNTSDKYVKATKTGDMRTEKDHYKRLSSMCDKFGQKWAYINRMNFIKKLKSKTDAAKWILEHVIPQDIRTLIFCSLIDQADQLCEHRFHSKVNGYDFDSFKEERINRLACVDALNEGHNIHNLDCGFVVQLDSNPLNLRQRIGRLLRYRSGHLGKIVILCTVDSVDKDWVEKAIKGLNMTKITWVDLSKLQAGTETITF